MLDDTCYFLGFDDISEALIVLAILNSSYTQDLLRTIALLMLNGHTLKIH